LIKGIEERRVVLRFDKTTLMVDRHGGGETVDAQMDLRSGELVLIRYEKPRMGLALADACTGLVHPEKGAVTFLGKDWSDLPSDTANALRGRIGRVFREGKWLSHLSVLANILLPQLHHTRRPAAELRDEAAAMALRFRLPGVPAGRPADLMRADLQRAACVRAFLGRPSLIVLEDPTSGKFSMLTPELINVIRSARDDGATVIWLTLENVVWRDQTIPATTRYRLIGRTLMEVEP
jgi:phospholipid/cholesterol/gamma-HCH transport system ATP-binding protein